jgi:hypothetical protein
MALAPPESERRRARPGSLERPINARLYRGTWLLVALPLLLAAFSVERPAPLPSTNLPAAFNREAAFSLATDLASSYPNRFPGSAGALGAANWLREQLRPYGYQLQREPFEATIPGYGRVRLENLLAVAQGRSSRVILVMAHRDDTGAGPGANDNASGTAALIELARAYASPGAAAGGARRVRSNYTLVFLSSDGGAFGSLGAADFAAHSPYRNDVVAAIDLDAIAAPAPLRLQLAGDRPRSPAASLVETAASQIQLETGAAPSRPSALQQLVDLGFPFSVRGQSPLVARAIPAIGITSGGDRPPASFADTPGRLDSARLGQAGRAAQRTIDTLDQGLNLAQGSTSYVYLGSRIVRGWAIELVLIAALLPYLAAVVDLFARCRRRRIPVAPALRSYRSRLGFWLWSGAIFGLFALTGVWPDGAPRPPALESSAARHWPAIGLLALGGLMLAGWLVGRERLIPRRPVRPTEQLAGHTAALLALGVVALLVVATNPFALLFLLPSLHVWLWLPQVRDRPAWTRAAVLVLGFAGPALLLGSFASRYGLGLDAPWYVAELFSLGYAPAFLFVIGLGWLAGAAQLTALTAGRYAPYPAASERSPRGPLRELVHRSVVAQRTRRRRRDLERKAAEG